MHTVKKYNFPWSNNNYQGCGNRYGWVGKCFCWLVANIWIHLKMFGLKWHIFSNLTKLAWFKCRCVCTCRLYLQGAVWLSLMASVALLTLPVRSCKMKCQTLFEVGGRYPLFLSPTHAHTPVCPWLQKLTFVM